MKRYIEQLTEDFKDAAGKAPSPNKSHDPVETDDPDEVDMSHVEEYLYGMREPLSQILGIEKNLLPPLEKLTEQQADILYNGMERLLKAYHFVPDFPEGLPSPIKYRLMRDKWDSDQAFVSGGEIHMEFCHYEPDECPFPKKYCDCKKFQLEME